MIPDVEPEPEQFSTRTPRSCTRLGDAVGACRRSCRRRACRGRCSPRRCRRARRRRSGRGRRSPDAPVVDAGVDHVRGHARAGAGVGVGARQRQRPLVDPVEPPRVAGGVHGLGRGRGDDPVGLHVGDPRALPERADLGRAERGREAVDGTEHDGGCAASCQRATAAGSRSCLTTTMYRPGIASPVLPSPARAGALPVSAPQTDTTSTSELAARASLLYDRRGPCAAA